MINISKTGILIFLLFLLAGRGVAQNSVLSSGSWYKVGVVKDGIYKLSYADLQTLGISVASIDPRNLRVYGNGGGMLPMLNSDPRPVDLIENSIEVVGESDGTFDLNDYILFYGQSQDRWKYNSTDGHFHHTKNMYADTTFYFLTVGTSQGKRMQRESSLTSPPSKVITQYDDYAFHELDSLNFLHSGQSWYGEELTIPNNKWSHSFYFPSIFSSVAYAQFSFLGKSITASLNVNCTAEGNVVNTLIPKGTSSVTSDFARQGGKSVIFYTGSDTVTVSFDLTSTDTSALAWLDFVEVNVLRQMKKTSGQNIFRSLFSAGAGSISDFNITNTTAGDSVWDVTDPFNVLHVNTSYSGGTTSMRLATDSLKEFIISGSAFLPAILIGQIPNQNLHSIGPVKMLIITHPDFLGASQSIAALHQSHDGLTVSVATTSQIYNEFSSGAQDVAAIRDFIRMVYLKSTPSDSLRYVLLMGDASYDLKNRLPNNTNFVPAYQSVASLNLTNTYTSDDFFSLLDGAEGVWDPNTSFELPDVGIGRLPAKTSQEAMNMRNKIARYYSPVSLGDWRKTMTFVADDQDQNTHFSQTETLANMIDTAHCEYNIEKIYLDAFVQDTTGGIQTYPTVNKAIKARINNGALFINWLGHADTYQWSHENVLDTTMVDNFNNANFLPLFFCGTAAFGCMDDPGYISGGERLLLNPAGGGMGLLSATRLAFSSSNFSFENAFFKHLLAPTNNSILRLGDIMKNTKSDYNDRYTRNFVYLGDPAIRLAYPINKVVTTKINGSVVGANVDSLNAGSTVTVEGEITDPSGILLSSFNGSLNVVVFDHEMTKITKGNDSLFGAPGGNSYRVPYKAWSDTLFSGVINVTNGLFSFNFVLPTTIDITYSFCKISYYAQNGTIDAGGCYDNAMIGGGTRVGIDELVQADVLVYPNPAHNECHFRIGTEQKSRFNFSLYEITGRLVMEKKNLSSDFTIDLRGESSGLYIYRLESADKKWSRRGKLSVD